MQTPGADGALYCVVEWAACEEVTRTRSGTVVELQRLGMPKHSDAAATDTALSSYLCRTFLHCNTQLCLLTARDLHANQVLFLP